MCHSISVLPEPAVAESFLKELWLIARRLICLKTANIICGKISLRLNLSAEQILKRAGGWLLVSRPQIDWRQNSERPASRCCLSQLPGSGREIFTPLLNNRCHPNPTSDLFECGNNYIHPKLSPVDLIHINTNYSFSINVEGRPPKNPRLEGHFNIAFFLEMLENALLGQLWLLSFRLESCISSCSTPPLASPSTRIGTPMLGTTWRWCWTGQKFKKSKN